MRKNIRSQWPVLAVIGYTIFVEKPIESGLTVRPYGFVMKQWPALEYS